MAIGAYNRLISVSAASGDADLMRASPRGLFPARCWPYISNKQAPNFSQRCSAACRCAIKEFRWNFLAFWVTRRGTFSSALQLSGALAKHRGFSSTELLPLRCSHI